jgi:ABC-2 type transport system ATP-binding protein
MDELVSLLQERVEGIKRARQVDGGVALHAKGTNGVLARVVTEAEGAGFEVADISVAAPSLEDVFISLTGKELRD